MLDGPDESASDGVLSEQSPYEPEEFDPDSLGPSAPEAPRPPDGTGNSEVTGLFWKLVLVFNVALLALSLGPMLAYFDGQVDLGIRVFLVGLAAFGYGTFRYVRFKKDREEESTASKSDGDHNR